MFFKRKKWNKVFGIGLPRTGTKTLGQCFHVFNLSHTSFDIDALSAFVNNDILRLVEIARRYKAFEDIPWCFVYKEMDAHYPDSRFILTTRKDPQTWEKSAQNHIITGLTTLDDMPDILHLLKKYYISEGYTDPSLTEIYLDHIENVKNYFSLQPEKLLVVSWENGDGWKEICDFLNFPLPGIPFPHENRGTYA